MNAQNAFLQEKCTFKKIKNKKVTKQGFNYPGLWRLDNTCTILAKYSAPCSRYVWNSDQLKQICGWHEKPLLLLLSKTAISVNGPSQSPSIHSKTIEGITCYKRAAKSFAVLLLKLHLPPGEISHFGSPVFPYAAHPLFSVGRQDIIGTGCKR